MQYSYFGGTYQGQVCLSDLLMAEIKDLFNENITKRRFTNLIMFSKI